MSKAKNLLSKTWLANVADIAEDQAADLLVKAEMKIKDLEEELAQDDQLNAAKQIVKDLGAGYSTVIKMEKARIAFLLDKIREIQEGVNPTASV